MDRKRRSVISVKMERRFAVLLVTAFLAVGPVGRAVFGASPSLVANLACRVRRPVAVAFDRDGRRLFVANRRSGSISVLDPTGARVLAESDVGEGLADLVALPDGRRWLAVDQAADALLLLVEREGALRVIDRQPVRTDPVSLTMAGDGSICVVASRWSRALSFFSIRETKGGTVASLSPVSTLTLPFSPRALLPVREGTTLLVADAFGGRLGVVDSTRQALERVVALPAHNIGGLAVTPDGKRLIVSHQVLNAGARTIPEDVQWGILLNNDLRVFELDRLLAPSQGEDPSSKSRLINLGEVSRGAGDPGALVYHRNGTLVLALSGVDQVAIGPEPAQLQRRTSVGRRPRALAASPSDAIVCVADGLDDTISVIDLATGQRTAQISLGPVPTPTLAELGERLFFDARLSRGGWMSCQSCHTDGHSNGLNVDTFGDGDFGAPKRVPSLLGGGATAPWGWKGDFETLEAQVHQSALTTMQGVWPTDDEVAELSAFIRSLEPARPLVVENGIDRSVERGRVVFQRECVRCHSGSSYTSSRRHDVGLEDEVGNRRFNPPSLRGVGSRQPLLHDGRAPSLREVFDRFGHPNQRGWTSTEVDDLVAFLQTL